MTDPIPVLRVGAYAVIERDGAVLLARWIGPTRRGGRCPAAA